MKRAVWVFVVSLMATSWLLWPHPSFSHVTTTNTVLYDREVVGILNRHCATCHANDGVSFSLVTYEETWLQRAPILAEVLTRHMPPWAAVAGYGEFANANSLTLREVQFLISWVEGLGPRNAGTVFLNIQDGGTAAREEVRAHAPVGLWQLGEPDLASRVAALAIAPSQADEIQRTVIDLGLTSERRVRGLEFVPDDRRVVRAAFFTVEETGQWLGSWTPWHSFVDLPEGLAYRLPAGTHIVAEIHYRSTHEPVVARGTLGLFFAELPAATTPADLVLEAAGEVPAGATVRFRAVTRLRRDTYTLSLRPEVSPGITSIEVSARQPDGATEILLFAKDIQISWPTPYILKRPVRLPAGTELSATAYYANTSGTPQPGGIRLTVSRYE